MPTLRAVRWVNAVVARALCALAPDTAERCGAALGRLVFHAGIRRAVVRANLTTTLGIRGSRRREIARRSYAHIGADFLVLWAATPESVAEGLEVADPQWMRLLGRRHGAVIFLSPHLGAWEVGARGLVETMGRFVVYVTPQHDADWDERINTRRRGLGLEILYSAHGDRRSAVRAIRLLREDASICLLADQGPRPQRGVPGHFLGRPTYCHGGPGFFARRTGKPLVVGVGLRCGVARWRVYIGRPLPAADEATAVQQGLDAMSALIARFPSQYFWHHRRFKYPADLLPRDEEPWRIRGLELVFGERRKVEG